MGSSCSSLRKKERSRSRRSSSDVGSPLDICGQRRCSERSVESLPYGAKSSPPTAVRSQHPASASSTSEANEGSKSGESFQTAILNPSQAAKDENHLKIGPPSPQPISQTPSPFSTSPANKIRNSGLPHLSHYNNVVKSVLLGHVQEAGAFDASDLDLISPKEIVIFLVSPETPKFLEETVRELKTVCANKGYDLSLLDLTLGVEPICINDHSYKRIYLDTLRSFRRSKQKVIHFVMFSEEEGFAPLPLHIDQDDFETFNSSLATSSLQEIFNKWYIFDENCISAQFSLQNISDVIPEFHSENQEELKQAVKSWRADYSAMVSALKGSTVDETLRAKYLVPLFEETMKNMLDGPHSLLKQTFLVQLDTGLANDRLSHLKISLDKQLPDSQKVYAPRQGNNEISEDALRTLKSNLQKMIEAIIEEESQEESLHPYVGPEFGLHSELLQQELIRQRLAAYSLNVDVSLKLIESYINSNTNYPLVLCGPMGCGKSSLLAKACSHISSLFPCYAVLYRFVAMSEESRKHQQVLRSICEQMCIVLGKHPAAASGILKGDRSIISSILQLTQEKPLFILIDGLDQAVCEDPEEVLWLTEKLPATVKVVVSVTNSSECQTFLRKHLDGEAFVDLPSPSNEELMSIIESELNNHGKKLTDAQKVQITLQLHNLPSPLYAHTLGVYLLHSNVCNTSENLKIPERIEELLSGAVTSARSSVGLNLVESVVSMFSVLKHGLSNAQLLDILCEDQQVAESVLVYSNGTSERFSHWLWFWLKEKLGLFFSTRLVGRKNVLSWKNDYIRTLVSAYVSQESRCSAMLRLLDYFKNCPLINFCNDVDNLSNRYKSEEVPFLSLTLDPSTFTDSFLFNIEWLYFKLRTSDPFSLIEDINMFQATSDGNEEAEFLRHLISICAFPLRYDGSQFLSQLYARLNDQFVDSKCEKVNHLVNVRALYEAACQPFKPSLFPLNTQFMDVDKCDSPAMESLLYSDEEGEVAIHAIKGDIAHVISLSSDAGEIIVWNVNEQRPVRILKGINQPRDLKMIDTYRAIVLCNRELVVYNLDAGVMESKLKGVMNQRMPFFGLHDDKYVVALSRNRMYVNMINLLTGDLETQFKVGEDRFLNSLLVSANGKICVCGDETQKPFPLLVWDLSNRKLLYDLRIPHHEFITRLAAISDDGHYVVSVCKELNTSSPNFIIVYDLQSGTLFKKWKPESNTRSIAISSQGGYVMNGIENCRILVWDLSTGAKKYTLAGHFAPVNVLQVNETGKILMSLDTSCMDRSVRLWDLDLGVCLAVFTPDHSLSCCQLLPEGKTVVFSFRGEIKLHTLCLCHQDSLESRKVVERSVYGKPENDGCEFVLSTS